MVHSAHTHRRLLLTEDCLGVGVEQGRKFLVAGKWSVQWAERYQQVKRTHTHSGGTIKSNSRVMVKGCEAAVSVG